MNKQTLKLIAALADGDAGLVRLLLKELRKERKQREVMADRYEDKLEAHQHTIEKQQAELATERLDRTNIMALVDAAHVAYHQYVFDKTIKPSEVQRLHDALVATEKFLNSDR